MNEVVNQSKDLTTFINMYMGLLLGLAQNSIEKILNDEAFHMSIEDIVNYCSNEADYHYLPLFEDNFLMKLFF